MNYFLISFIIRFCGGERVLFTMVGRAEERRTSGKYLMEKNSSEMDLESMESSPVNWQ